MNQYRKINVLQLVEGFNLGGAEKKLWELIDHMDRKKFRLVVCSLGLGDEIRDYFEKLDAKIITLERKFKIDPTLIWRLGRLIREEKIDVVMTTLFYADVLGALVGKAAGAKAVFSWETISSPKWLVPHRLYSYRCAIRLADRVISVSNATSDWLIQKRGVSPYSVTVIPYGVNLSLYHQKENKAKLTELGISKDDPIVGMTGRLHSQKGHIYLIEAAREISRQIPNVRFLIIGDGPLREDLIARVKAYKLDSNFFFLGFRHDVPELLRCLDIFTLPSLYQGLPNVVLEAMATGKPVVATPVDGTKEAVLDGRTGLLVPEKNPAKLADALLSLLRNPMYARELGQNGRNRVKQLFSLETQVKKFEELYETYSC